MTAFLSINGIPLSVADGAASSSVDDVGVSARMSDGSLVRNRRAVKSSWDFDTVLDVQATALAVKGLVLGAGHVWDFNSSLYSAKGLAVTTSGALSSTQKKYGSQSLQLPASTAVEINTTAYDYQFRPWTAAFWWYRAGAWKHIVETSANKRWENGVYIGTRFYCAASSYYLNIGDGDPTTRYIDDLWVAEYVMPDSWAASIYAAGAPAGGAPRLTASGLLIDGGTRSVTCYGEVKSLKTQQAWVGGSWSIVHALQATLTEV